MKRFALAVFALVAFAVLTGSSACRQEHAQTLRRHACSAIIAVPALPDTIAAWALDQRGLAAYRQHRLIEASTNFRAATVRNPAHPYAWNNLGNVHRTRGAFAEAETAYARAIVLRPRYGRAYHNRSAVRFALGDLGGALADANASVALQPTAASPITVRGNIRLALGDYAGALADQNKAVALNAAFLTSVHNRACAHAALGNIAVAARDVVRARNRADLGEPAPRAYLAAFVALRLDFQLGRASATLTGAPNLQRMDCSSLALPHHRHAGRLAHERQRGGADETVSAQ